MDLSGFQWDFNGFIPSGQLRWLWKITILYRKTHCKLQCSIAVSKYSRVIQVIMRWCDSKILFSWVLMEHMWFVCPWLAIGYGKRRIPLEFWYGLSNNHLDDLWISWIMVTFGKTCHTGNPVAIQISCEFPVKALSLGSQVLRLRN